MHAGTPPPAGTAGAPVHDDGPPYLWSDLVARRVALGLRSEQMADVLRIDKFKYSERESGARAVGPFLAEELLEMEDFVAQRARELIAAAPADGVVRLDIVDQEAFTTAYPDAATLRDAVPYPVELHQVAVGRAAAELTRQGHTVTVHNGENHGDLTARRAAVGLQRSEAAALLKVETRHYYTHEKGAKEPPAGLIAELQAIDDFIATTAAALDTTVIDGVNVVLTVAGQREFEDAHPEAKTLRDGIAYPYRVHHVAAARRAGELAAGGYQSRILVPPR